jgi:SseB protein N-terminal domain
MRFRTRTPASRILRLRNLLILVDGPPALPVGSFTLEEDLDVGVVSQVVDGKTVLPAFTSEEALLRWRPEGGPYIGLEGRAFIALVIQHGFDGVVVDPGQPGSLEVSRDELSAVAG